MGFWKDLFGTDPNGHFSHVRSENCSFPYHKGEKIIPAKKISEPVLSEPVRSIIQTLKDVEWSFEASSGLGYYSLYFTHEWFGNKLVVWKSNYNSPEDKPECQSKWMTQTERESVGSVCWQIYQGRVDWEREQSLAKQRESFMILVKEK